MLLTAKRHVYTILSYIQRQWLRKTCENSDTMQQMHHQCLESRSIFSNAHRLKHVCMLYTKWLNLNVHDTRILNTLIHSTSFASRILAGCEPSPVRTPKDTLVLPKLMPKFIHKGPRLLRTWGLSALPCALSCRNNNNWNAETLDQNKCHQPPSYSLPGHLYELERWPCPICCVRTTKCVRS